MSLGPQILAQKRKRSRASPAAGCSADCCAPACSAHGLLRPQQQERDHRTRGQRHASSFDHDARSTTNEGGLRTAQPGGAQRQASVVSEWSRKARGRWVQAGRRRQRVEDGLGRTVLSCSLVKLRRARFSVRFARSGHVGASEAAGACPEAEASAAAATNCQCVALLAFAQRGPGSFDLISAVLGVAVCCRGPARTASRAIQGHKTHTTQPA